MTADDHNESAINELARLTDELVKFTSNGIAVEGDLTAPEFKEMLAAKRAELFAKKQAMEKAADDARKQMEAAQAAARAAMIPLQKELAKMAEGIWTVGLYLGVGEQIVPLRGGSPAPVETPISVRQQVLAMDEESIIAAAEGGIDVNNIEAFDEWILANPAHLEQVLPEQKGVVAILPSRQQRDYGNPWMNASMNEANQQTWFLIRNGERLYRLLAGDFNVGSRLIPRSDEFTSYFVKDRWGHPIAPGTPQWSAAEESAGAKQRHYMRVALILQGMVERTTVFHPMPEGVSMLSLESYERGHIVTISDDEKVLTSSRQPFSQWIAERMKALRPGMRVVGAFHGQEFRNANQYDQYGRHSRLTPETAENPPSMKILYVEQNSRKELVCRYDRVEESIWDANSYSYRPAQKRASVRISRDDSFLIPIDLINVKEMEEYLDARTERQNYLTLVPLLQAAIAAKKDEHEQEAPFRRLIADTLAVHHGEDPSTAEATAADLIDWWKFSNRYHRPLVNDDPELVAKAMRLIVSEYKARAKAGGNESSAQTIQTVRGIEPRTMAVLRKRDGSVIALVPETSKYGFVPENVFFSQYRYVNGGLSLIKEWSVIAPHVLSKMQEMWSNGEWQKWDKTRALTGVLTDPEVQQVIDAVSGREGLLLIQRVSEYEYGFGDRDGFTVYCYRGNTGQFSIGWSHEKTEALVIEKNRISYRRKGNSFEVTVGENTSSSYWNDSNTPWGDQEKNVVFVNRELMAKAVADMKPIALEAERKRAISRRLSDLSSAIRRAWAAKKEESARTAHIAEYGSDDLWNQWLKSHPLPQLNISTKSLEDALLPFVEKFPAPSGKEIVVSDYYHGANASEMDGIVVTDNAR